MADHLPFERIRCECLPGISQPRVQRVQIGIDGGVLPSWAGSSLEDQVIEQRDDFRLTKARGIESVVSMHLDGEPQADRISLPVGTITVAGEGRVAARPDIAITTLGVDVYATSLSEAMAEAAGTMERVWQTLRGAGLQDADLRTARYSVQVERPYDQKTGRPSDSQGYRVVNLVEARIRDLGRVGVILDEAIAAG